MIKGTPTLLLKNPWNLTPAERQRLSRVVKLNSRLVVRAYSPKEEFWAFWDYVRTGWASTHFAHWLRWASHSRLAPFQKLIRLVRPHFPELGPGEGHQRRLEGRNNKVKLVSHRTYGSRNPQHFIAAFCHFCAQLPLPA